MVLRSRDRSGEQFSVACAEEFKETLDKMELADLTLMGGKWT